MGLLERIQARTVDRTETRYSADQWISEYLVPAYSQFAYQGHNYPLGLNQTLLGNRAKEIANTLPGYLAALRFCPPAFAAQMVRAMVLSQARFTFRTRQGYAKAGQTFGTRELDILERPWTNATTGELVARMEWHAGLAGNAYVLRQPDRLRMLRPDWVVIVYGSDQEPEDAAHALDGKLIGYAYCNGGWGERRNPVHSLLPQDVAHWSPLPDPESAGVGMSWITPALREIQGDRLATDHKLRFFENGATPNMVVKGITAATREQFDDIVDAMESRHTGVVNAYRTLYLAAGADATVVGADLRQLDFKNTQGAGETRIAMLSRVHPVILGASEGLAGSSLNAGNFSAARRAWADSWIYPTLQDLAASLAPLVRVPPDAELWFNTGDMPILREDAKDAAEIEQVKAATISSYVTQGFTRKSAIAATAAQDVTLLQEDPDWISVQLQAAAGKAAPGASPATSTAGAAPKSGLGARDFHPDEPRDPHGKWSRIGALVEKLTRVGTHKAISWDDGDYADWSTRHTDGSFDFEIGDRRDVASLRLTPDDLAGVHDELTRTLRQTDDGHHGLDNDAYLSWEPKDDEGDRWDVHAVDADGNDVTLDWPRSRLEHLHTALTGTLLVEAHGQGDAQRARRLFRMLETRKFNPNEPRLPGGEHGGEWTAGGVLKDALKLAGKIELGPGEKLLGSDKVNGGGGSVRFALVDHGGVKSLRLGIGGPTFGGRYDDAGPWKAGPDPTAAINAERNRLRDEHDRIGDELDRLATDAHADPARKAKLQARYDELDDMDLGEVYPSGFTATLEPGAARQLHSTLSAALDAGAKLQAEIDADREPPRPQIGYWVLAEGSMPGGWADVHYEVYLDDPSVGAEVHLGASPHGSGMDVHDLTGNEQGAVLDAAEARKLLRLLDRYAGMGGASRSARAAGHDVTPGHDELHHYWTKGKGLAKWAGSPQPWTTLVAHLSRLPGVGPAKAKVYASRWFIEVFGYAAGSDKNRVAHGKPPRGHKIGPG